VRRHCDEDVEPARAVGRSRRNARGRPAKSVMSKARVETSPPRRRCCGVLEARGSRARSGDMRAPSRQRLGDLEPQPARSAWTQRDATLERESGRVRRCHRGASPQSATLSSASRKIAQRSVESAFFLRGSSRCRKADRATKNHAMAAQPIVGYCAAPKTSSGAHDFDRVVRPSHPDPVVAQ